jgi:putative copper resistance protein D
MSVATCVLTAADLAGTAPWQVLSDPRLALFAASYDLGRALLLITLVAVVAASTSRYLAGMLWTAGLLGLVSWAVGPFVAAGHAASAGAHTLAVAFLFVHVTAASLWCGGLVGVWHLRAERRTLVQLVPRYSTLALGCYIVLAASGLVTAWTRVGVSGWWSTWGAVAGVKIVVLAVLGVLGHAHRQSTVPLLRVGRTGAFVRLVAAELLLVGVVVAAAVTLAQTPAPAGTAPQTGGEHVDALTGLPVRLPPPTDHSALVQLHVDAPLLVVTTAAVVAYLTAARVHGRGGEPWSHRATASFVAGSLLLAWAWCGSPGVYATATVTGSYARALLLLLAVPALWRAGSPLALASRVLRQHPPRLPRLGAPVGLIAVAVLFTVLHSGSWIVAAQTRPHLRTAAAMATLVVGCLVSHVAGRGARSARCLFAACLAGVVATQGLVLAADRALLEAFSTRTGLPWLSVPADAAGLVGCALAGACLALVLSRRAPVPPTSGPPARTGTCSGRPG